MKKILLLSFTLWLQLATAQTISPGIFGQNANLTDTVGTNVNAGGHLDEYWQTTGPYSGQNYIAESKTKFMRYGGIQVENDCDIDGVRYTFPPSNLDITIADYVSKAIAIQNNGIEPMMTLPLKFNSVSGPLFNFTQCASKAKLLVKGVNDSLVATNHFPVVYWVYSNEPEAGGLHYYDDTTAADKIHDYIEAFHDSVLTIWDNAWNTSISGSFSGPQFVGPELISFDNYDHGSDSGKVDKLIQQLCGLENQLAGPINAHDIRPFISVFSWHIYPFGNEAQYQGDIPAANRSNVVNYLSNGAPSQDASFTTTPLAHNIDSLRVWLGTDTIRLAITEANICHNNDVFPFDSYNVTNDAVSGYGTNSFIGGQFWAELMGICMEKEVSFLNFWSAVEGCYDCSGADSLFSTNLGFLNGDTATGVLGTKKSSFYHFKMLAENFEGDFCQSTIGSTYLPNLKVIAAKTCNGPAVMIMNQNASTNISYKLKLDNTALPSGPYAPINVNAKINRSFEGNILAKATQLLIFDECGRLKELTDYSETANTMGFGPASDPYTYWSRCDRCLKSTELSIPECSIDTSSVDTVLFSVNTTIDTSTIFNDVLIVRNGATLTLDSAAFVFRPDTYIKVEQGGKLYISDAWLMGCDANTWDGIRIRGGNDTIQQLIIHNSIIDDADVAIKADQTKEIVVDGSAFANGRIAFELDSVSGFHISSNDFAGFSHDIVTTNSFRKASEIYKNFFADAVEAISMEDDEHSLLNITCNNFVNYEDYAIHSSNCVMKDQGDSLNGAGNEFTSSSTLTNHRFLHQGNAIKYYTDPSRPFILSTSGSMNATADTALIDGCTEDHHYTPLPIAGNVRIPAPSALITIVPNPSSGHVTFNFSTNDNGYESRIIVSTLYGTQVKVFIAEAGSSSFSADLSGLENGIYFTTLQQNGKQLASTKMIIVH
jgi:hypothetical protein